MATEHEIILRTTAHITRLEAEVEQQHSRIAQLEDALLNAPENLILRSENTRLRSVLMMIADTSNWRLRQIPGEPDFIWVGLIDPIADASSALQGR